MSELGVRHIKEKSIVKKRENQKESEKVQESVTSIKQAVDTEVKEKFNTKTTDAKDIFNELFGEAKK